MSGTAIEGKAIPQLASLDLDETEAFYHRLGFATGARYPDYLIVTRGPLEIHFWACADRHVAENTSCYLRLTEVDALHAEFAAAGIERLTPVQDRPWGMREFYVIDPSGNLLRIGRPIDR